MANSNRHRAQAAIQANPRAISSIPRGRAGRARRAIRYGIAATEFAIVAPLFLLLVIGILELGRALMVQQVLVNASRVGAREAVTLGATTGSIQATVEDYTASVAVPGVTVSVTPSPTSTVAGDPITVTASVPFNAVSWLPSPWFLGGNTLTASSRMRKEGFE
jgi:Flp pilus assembly protein TadG